MSILLGIRIAFAGGTESLARNALTAAGVAVGVLLLLLTLTAMPVLQRHIDRLAWHRTTAASPPTAPDPALWLAVTDRYSGRDIIRVHVAALGPRPPVPPGVDRLPGPGEVVVSPALAELMRTVPDDQLRDRFPGQVIGTIGPDGLIAPAELVGIVGRTPEELRDTHEAVEIRGIEQPGMRISMYGFYRLLISLVAVLIVGPVVVFVAMVTRIGAARREQRFTAIRLAGATRLQTAALAATETAAAAIAGTLLGLLGFLAARPTVASHVTLGHDIPIFVEDLTAPIRQLLLVLVAVPVLAVATTLVALHRVQSSPLGPACARGAGARGTGGWCPWSPGSWASGTRSRHRAPQRTSRPRCSDGSAPSPRCPSWSGSCSPDRWSATGSAVAWPGRAGARPR